MKVIKIKLGDVGKAIQELEAYKKWLSEKAKELIERLAKIGVEVAAARFKNAQYDGDNDVVVESPRWVDDNKMVLVARGNAVTFIEFGTGVRYTEVHPLAADKGAIRGGYGKGKGNKRSWSYYGNPGTNGRVVRESSLGTVVRTEGNPPAMAMYEATKEMREKIAQIAKEVFK